MYGVFVLLEVFLVWFVSASSNAASGYGAAWALGAMCFASNILLLYAITNRKIGIPAIFITYFVGVAFGVTGLYEELAGVFPWPVRHSAAQGTAAVLAMSLFLGFFFLGQKYPGAILKDARVLPFGGRTQLLVYFLLLASLICAALVGPASLFTPRTEMTEMMTADNQVKFVGKSVLLPAYLYLILVYRRLNSKDRLRIWPPLILSCIMALVWFNPVTSPRFQFLGFVVSTLVVLFSWWQASPLTKAVFPVLLFLANYVFFGPLKSVSSGANGFDSRFYSDVFKSIRDYSYGPDFDSYQVSANGIVYVERHGPDFGAGLLGTVFFFVPRSVWANKPQGASLAVHEDLGYLYTNLSYPLPMEIYSSGGFAFVAAFGFFFGRWLQGLVTKCRSNETDGVIGTSNLLLALLVGYLPIIMRGSLNAVTPQFGFSFVAVELFWLAGKVRE